MDACEIIYPWQLMVNATNNSDGNILISPESCYSLFSSTLDGFDEETKRFLLGKIFQQSVNHAKSLNLFEKKLWKKTKLFIRQESPLNQDFKEKLENKYGCDVDEVDMKNAESAGMMNLWIKENVDELNCDIFKVPNINNILKMNFEWDSNINIETSRKKFHTSNDSFDTDYIDFNGTFGYVDVDLHDVKIIEIPLSSENLSVLFIVPNKEVDLNYLEILLPIPQLHQVLSKMQNCKMTVSVPKLKFKQEYNLEDILRKHDFKQYPYNFGKTDAYRLGEMTTISSIEMTERGIKTAALSGCQLLLNPIVKEMIYETNISSRFATTLITSRVENVENFAQETTFTVVLPEDAFITEFVMEIRGKRYKSYIEEKDNAKYAYDIARRIGRGAAHVAVSARDSNKFTVSVNIERESEMKFLLTYEELLQRKFDQYELVLNIRPGQLVQVLKVLTIINEGKPLKFVKTPAMRSGNTIASMEEVNSFSKIEKTDNTAFVTLNPTIENQKEISRMLGSCEEKGISGQFVVQYDVQLDPSNGEVLVNDGYFVHFYAPDDLPVLAKHVVFALDTSGSMNGRKMEQLKDAMKCILDQIKTNDLVDILDFTTHITFHDINSGSRIPIKYEQEENFHEPFYKYQQYDFPDTLPANEDIIRRAKDVVNRLGATSSTNIIGALETALYLVKLRQEKHKNYQPMIIFLTDGQPNVCICNTAEISDIVTSVNYKSQKCPIFALSFGEDADKTFLKKLALDNYGFSRHIYEASDASLQLQQFYKQISSPLLSEVNFIYGPDVTQVTRTQFPIYFRGSDIAICGRQVDPKVLSMIVNLHRKGGCEDLIITVEKSTTQIERLWAYLTVKQLLEQRERVEDKTELTKKALELALKYSFVTEVTSLVVVRPEDSCSTQKPASSVANIENASMQTNMSAGAFAPSFHMSQSSQSFGFASAGFACAPPSTYGASQSGFGASQSGFGASPSGFGASISGFGASPSGFGASPSGFGASPSGFGASTSGFGASSPGFGTAQLISNISMFRGGGARNSSTQTSSLGTVFGTNPTFGSVGGSGSTFGGFTDNAPQNLEISTGGYKIIVENLNSNNIFDESRDQVDNIKENVAPRHVVVDRPFLMLIKFKLDNKYIISFKGKIGKPIFNH